MNTNNAAVAGIQQVTDFCKNIEVWFNGTSTDRKALSQNILSTFESSFTMMNGDGVLIDFETLSQWLTTVYGQYPTRRIELRNIQGYATFCHVVVQYEEIQITGDERTERQSSAIFLLQNHTAKWYHLIERWV